MKNFDFKAMFIDHGEKIALGLIGLLALLALSVGTDWAADLPGTPEEMETKAVNTRSRMQNSTWAADERRKFEEVPDIRQQSQTLSQPVDSSRYAYTAGITWPIVQPREKTKEPKWERPRDLIADFDRIIVWAKTSTEILPGDDEAVPLDGEALPGASEEASGEDEDEFKGEFDLNKGGGGAEGRPYRQRPTEGEREVQIAKMLESGGVQTAEGRRKALKNTSRGERYVAVRGIFDLRDQRSNMAKAFNLSENDRLVHQLIRIIDIHIERKEAIPGLDPWAADWEAVDLETALEVLSECNGLDPDVIRPGVTDPVCTMPLPPRVMGVWRYVSHPDVEEYKVSEAEQAFIARKQALLLELAAEVEESRRAKRAEKRGFGEALQDINSARLSVIQGGLHDKFVDQMQAFTGEFGPAGARRMEPIRSGAGFNRRRFDATPTASGNLLLIRYLDFAVQPGNSYRYRVRLEFGNPNFGADITDLVNPDSRNGKTRMTAWSEMSDPVVVPPDYEYYVRNVDQRSGRDPSAAVEMFQWSPEAGTKVSFEFRKLKVGQYVGGTTVTDVIRPGAETFEEEEFEFSSRELIVDLDGIGRMIPEDHPDLKFRDRKGDLGIADEMLVVNQRGELVTMDTISKSRQRKKAEDYMERMKSSFEKFKSGAMTDADGRLIGPDPFGGEPVGGRMVDAGEESSRARRKRGRRGSNPLATGGKPRRTARGSSLAP